MTHYISSKEIIGQVLTDFNVPKTDYIDRMYDWIRNALEIMEMEKYYTNSVCIKDIENNKTTLPCCIEFLHSIWVPKVEGGNCRNDKGLQKLTIRNNPLIGKLIKDNYHPHSFGTVDGNFLYTSFEKGQVIIFYRGVPVDKEGYPLVPRNAKVKEALPFYIIYRLGLSGYDHPRIKWNEAYQMWERLYPAASNSVDWMDLTEYQEFTEMWNNPILGDLANNNYIH